MRVFRLSLSSELDGSWLMCTRLSFLYYGNHCLFNGEIMVQWFWALAVHWQSMGSFRMSVYLHVLLDEGSVKNMWYNGSVGYSTCTVSCTLSKAQLIF